MSVSLSYPLDIDISQMDSPEANEIHPESTCIQVLPLAYSISFSGRSKENEPRNASVKLLHTEQSMLARYLLLRSLLNPGITPSKLSHKHERDLCYHPL